MKKLLLITIFVSMLFVFTSCTGQTSVVKTFDATAKDTQIAQKWLNNLDFGLGKTDESGNVVSYYEPKNDSVKAINEFVSGEHHVEMYLPLDKDGNYAIKDNLVANISKIDDITTKVSSINFPYGFTTTLTDETKSLISNAASLSLNDKNKTIITDANLGFDCLAPNNYTNAINIEDKFLNSSLEVDSVVVFLPAAVVEYDDSKNDNLRLSYSYVFIPLAYGLYQKDANGKLIDLNENITSLKQVNFVVSNSVIKDYSEVK